MYYIIIICDAKLYQSMHPDMQVYIYDAFYSNYTQVDFLGEEGIDGGGLKRELFSILGKEIFNSLFDGGVLRHDVIALQVFNY